MDGFFGRPKDLRFGGVPELFAKLMKLKICADIDRPAGTFHRFHANDKNNLRITINAVNPSEPKGAL